MSINVFDNDLNIIWSNQVKLPYEDIRSDIQFHSLDDNGFVYFNCYLSNKNSKKKDSKNYVFLIYPPNNELPIVKMINVLDIDVYDIDYEVTKDKLVVGAGFYLEDDIISGIFKLELNSLEDEFQIEKFPFTKNIVNMLGMKPGLPFHFKKTGLVMYSDAKSKLRSSKLQTKGIEVQEDGRIIFIGEQAYIIDSSSGSFKHSDNILFSIISPEGTLELLKIIPKRHFTKDCNECLGYKYFDGPDNYNFFFVDDLKNMQNMTPDKMALCNLDKEGALYLYQINKSSGKENKKLILNKKDFSGHSIKIINTNKIVGFQGKFVIIDVEEGAKNNFLIKIPLD